MLESIAINMGERESGLKTSFASITLDIIHTQRATTYV